MNSESSPEERRVEQMEVLRRVMDKDWVVLRALALADQHPDVDIEALLEMARKQGGEQTKP